MTRLTDEQLMAYADGDPLGAAHEIVDRMRSGLSAEEQRALDDFRRTGELVRRAYLEDAVEPPPPALVAMILGHQPDAKGVAAPSGVTGADQPADVIAIKPRSTLPRPAAGLGLAMAASLAALFAAVFLWSMPGARTDIAHDLVPGPVEAGSALANVLETQGSGHPVPAGRSSDGRDHLMVAGTFRDRNARICREFEVLDVDLVPRLAAVACRSGETGSWRVEGTAAIARQDGGDGTSFAPAGAPEQEALAALMSLLGAAEIMKPEEERRLIESAWR